MSTSRVQETWKSKPLPLPPALPSAASCTLPAACGSTPSTFTSTSTSASAPTSTQRLAPQQRASPTTPKTPLSFEPVNVLTPPMPLRVQNQYTGRSRTVAQITTRTRTAIPTRSGLSSGFANSIPRQSLPLSTSSSPLRYSSVTREDDWNNEKYWKPVILTYPPPAHHARSSDLDSASESGAQVSQFPAYSGAYKRERVPISAVTVGSPSLRAPYPHTRQNSNKPPADIYLETKRVDYRAHDTIDNPEPSEDEDLGWSFFGHCACPIPAMTNLFALTPESTPNMLLHRNYFSERHLPLPP